MKTVILFFFASLFIYSAQAQISKGSVLLGGSLSFTDYDLADGSNDYENNYFTINPSLGFAVKENKVIGFNLFYGHGTLKNATPSERKTNNYGAGIFMRKYLPLGKSFFLYGEGDAGASYYKAKENTSSTSSVEAKNTSVSFSLFPGLSYAVSKKFHFELALNNFLNLSYVANKQENKFGGSTSVSKTKQLNLYANVNPTTALTIGFRVLLGNK